MSKVVILALLGDPNLLPGSQHAGGLNKTVKELLNYFLNKDLELLFITTTFNKEDYHLQLSKTIHLYHIAITEEEYLKQDLLVNKKNHIYAKIKTILLRYQDEIVLIHSLYWFSGLFSLYIQRDFHIPFIHSIISCAEEKIQTQHQPKSQYQLLIERTVFQKADYLLSITNHEKNNIIKYYHIDESKILIVGRNIDNVYNEQYIHKKLINQSYDLQIYSQVEKWNVYGAFTYFGRIVSIKGIKQIILAWEQCYLKYHEKTPPLWIIGGDAHIIQKFRNELFSSIPHLPLYENNQKIYWWGRLEPYGIASILQKTNVVIMHSKFEAGGRIVIESMKAGIPLIGTNVGFCKDMIQDWYNGFLVKYNHIQLLAFYLSLFIDNPFLSNYLGINARHTIIDLEKNWNYFQIHEHFYTKLIPPQTSYKNQFHKSKKWHVDIFPYTDLKANLLYPEVKSNENSYLWYDDKEKEYIKQYFHRFNYLKYIFEDQNEVLDMITLFKQTITSAQQIKDILPIIRKNNEQLFYVTQKCDLQKYNYYDEEMSCFLNQFHKRSINIENTFTIFGSYMKLLNHILELDHKKHIFPHKFKNILTAIKNQNYSFSKGLNYGKSYKNHIVKNKDSYFLLPTSTCFMGDLGIDEALTIIDEYGNNHHEFETIVNTLFDKNFNIYLWIILLLALYFIINQYLHIPNNSQHLLSIIYKKSYF